MPATPFASDFFGLTYDGNLSNFIDWMVYFYGVYEGGPLQLMAHLAEQAGGRQAVFLDIGANAGLYSLFMAPRMGQVHAFEPWAPVRDIMVRRLARNGLDNVHIHPVGLSDNASFLPYYAPATGNSGTGSFLAGANDNQESGRLQVVEGDSYLRALGLARVDLLKIDTEGFECLVLQGLSETLERYRPIVMFELSSLAIKGMKSPLPPAEAVGVLFGAGWSLWRIEERRGTLRLVSLEGEIDLAMVLAVPHEKRAWLPPGTVIAE